MIGIGRGRVRMMKENVTIADLTPEFPIKHPFVKPDPETSGASSETLSTSDTGLEG